MLSEARPTSGVTQDSGGAIVFSRLGRAARRWAVALDAGGLVFVDSDQLAAE
jgi:hypothetical protein